MARIWQLQEAKSKFSKLINEALREGPQIITRHGDQVAVVIAYEEYKQTQNNETSLIEFFRNSPLVDTDLDLDRDQSHLRPDAEL